MLFCNAVTKQRNRRFDGWVPITEVERNVLGSSQWFKRLTEFGLVEVKDGRVRAVNVGVDHMEVDAEFTACELGKTYVLGAETIPILSKILKYSLYRRRRFDAPGVYWINRG